MNPQYFLSQTNKADFSNKRILLRLDLDVPSHGAEYDLERMIVSLPTINFLLSMHIAKIGIIGHMGRPKGKKTADLSVLHLLEKLLGFIDPKYRTVFQMHENLRFDPGEEENDPKNATLLARDYDLYVFDAFAVSHRSHTSVVGIPVLLPTFLGFNMEQEITKLSTLFSPKRPYIAIVGGSKPETKIDLIKSLTKIADTVLVGGALARSQYRHLFNSYSNVIVAKLLASELDISGESVKVFKNYIVNAKTIIWDGPMGKVEEKKCEKGTRDIILAIQQSNADSIIGGGDTLGFFKRIHCQQNNRTYICMGGGAMLYYLTHKTLPLLKTMKPML